MRFRTLTSFDRDSTRLPGAHQQMFRTMLREHLLLAVDAGSFTGTPPWPQRLCVRRLAGTAIYSITWSIASPDGRATFHLERAADGHPVLVWRRIGTHSIDGRP